MKQLKPDNMETLGFEEDMNDYDEDDSIVNLDDSIWENPFNYIRNHKMSNVDRIMLYERYFHLHKTLRLDLDDLVDMELMTEEYGPREWTHADVLLKKMFLFGHTDKPAVVSRNILDNKAGIILNEVNAELIPESINNFNLYNRYPEIKDKLPGSGKVAWSPGAIQVLTIPNNDEQHFNLYVINFCTRAKYKEPINIEKMEACMERVRDFMDHNRPILPIFMSYYQKYETTFDPIRLMRLVSSHIPQIIFCLEEGEEEVPWIHT